ncbi:hypothetical protein G6F31_020640 [Rhizopus arrhizus]|nr:hypothetical protein G6F31_020640 [Rhizopus arrhizus]
MTLTGGGDIDLRIGGALNPTQNARGGVSSTSGPTPYYGDPAIDMQGALINLRGTSQPCATPRTAEATILMNPRWPAPPAAWR